LRLPLTPLEQLHGLGAGPGIHGQRADDRQSYRCDTACEDRPGPRGQGDHRTGSRWGRADGRRIFLVLPAGLAILSALLVGVPLPLLGLPLSFFVGLAAGFPLLVLLTYPFLLLALIVFVPLPGFFVLAALRFLTAQLVGLALLLLDLPLIFFLA